MRWSARSCCEEVRVRGSAEMVLALVLEVGVVRIVALALGLGSAGKEE